ncbi:MAG: MBL fold metallo-hydrolase [Rhodoferax sp.]|nr:MBL fold metallo-hydrolase [Rhodoferax sp.]
MKNSLLLPFALGLAALVGCSKHTSTSTASAADAVAQVQQVHAAFAKSSNLSDPASFADAARGLIAKPTGQIKGENGAVIWDFETFKFVAGDAPPTVNPSLWRQALLNNQVGLFKVNDHIWQVRGFDLANLTLIEGKTGWIVVDALTARETSAAAMAFARQHLGNKPVTALVFTHSHIDHFGGALGVIEAGEAAERKVPIVAPVGFMEEATSENILMSTAMVRRADYMYGNPLQRNAKGLIDTGLGKAVAYGRVGILEPTLLVDKPVQEVVLDGVRFVFHNVPGSEAPSEFVFALPDLKAFGGAEMMSQTLHNLYTIRGAKVRDALKWAAYLNDSLSWLGDAEVVFNQHHWPVWGKDRIHEFVTKQRDTYKFIHDQTVRMINAGLTGPEVAESLKLPKALQDYMNVRGYYGTVRHNAKAVYQYYMGWYDANPANLDHLPPVEAGKRYVELAGGPDKALASAQRAFDVGDYRWSAEVLKHVVYADSSNAPARELLARSFDQLGYLAEAATWRNAYLVGAQELRNGPPKQGMSKEMMLDMLTHTPIERFLEAMAANLNADKAGDTRLKINLVFTDVQESHVLTLDNAVLHHHKAAPASDANATLSLTKAFFLKMVIGSAGAKDLLLSKETKIDGSTLDLGKFFSLLDKPTGTFPIVTR